MFYGGIEDEGPRDVVDTNWGVIDNPALPINRDLVTLTGTGFQYNPISERFELALGKKTQLFFIDLLPSLGDVLEFKLKHSNPAFQGPISYCG